MGEGDLIPKSEALQHLPSAPNELDTLSTSVYGGEGPNLAPPPKKNVISPTNYPSFVSLILDRFSKNRQEEENTITFRLKCIVIA